MGIVLSAFTVVGGHLLAGKRTRGYLNLVLLALLPIFSWITQAIWLIVNPGRVPEAPFVAADFYWTMFATVWLSSIGFLVRDRRVASNEPARPKRARLILEVAIASIVSVCLIGFSVLSIGLASFLPKQGRSTTPPIAKADIGGRELPAGEGSVQFLGTIYVKGTAASNTRMVFLFDGGFISRRIVTDFAGRFDYRLPPGRWTLIAPYIPEIQGDIRFEIDPPVRPGQLLNVYEGPVSQTYRLVVRAD